MAPLYRWVAALTGSKNALKGVGFFLGGVLLAALTFRGAVLAMAVAVGLALVWLCGLAFLKRECGKARATPRFREISSKSRAINLLSAARLCLFGARDVWFVVALPVFLATVRAGSTGRSRVPGDLGDRVLGSSRPSRHA